MLLAASLSIGGCGDLATGPLVEVSTSETVPTLQFDASLPTFPDVVARWGSGLPADALAERWTRSWSRPAIEGARERDALYRRLAPELATSFTASDLEPLEARLEGTLEGLFADLAAETRETTRETLIGPVSRADASAEAARLARVGGDVEGALRHLLLAVDHLHSATPEAIARSLMRDAEVALRRNAAERSYPERRRERGERLLSGAKDALESGESELALRRAFYSHQLLTEAGDR